MMGQLVFVGESEGRMGLFVSLLDIAGGKDDSTGIALTRIEDVFEVVGNDLKLRFDCLAPCFRWVCGKRRLDEYDLKDLLGGLRIDSCQYLCQLFESLVGDAGLFLFAKCANALAFFSEVDQLEIRRERTCDVECSLGIGVLKRLEQWIAIRLVAPSVVDYCSPECLDGME